MLVVQRDGFLEGRVCEYVAVGQIFCDDARAGLVFLC